MLLKLYFILLDYIKFLITFKYRQNSPQESFLRDINNASLYYFYQKNLIYYSINYKIYLDFNLL